MHPATARVGLFVHLLRPVGMRASTSHKQRPTLLNQPTVQVFASEVTYRERSPISVSAVRIAVNFSARNMRDELVTGIYAASPMNTVRVEANLIGLGRVDALKPDLCRTDGQRVAVNDSRYA